MANGKAGAPVGNKNATNKGQLSSRLKKRLEDRKKLDELVDKLIDKALDGDMQAIKEVFDRVDGKSKQQLDITAEVRRSAEELSDDELASIAAAGG